MEANPSSSFSEDILNSAEMYGLYLSTLLEQQNSASLEETTDNISEFSHKEGDVHSEIELVNFFKYWMLGVLLWMNLLA